MSSIASKDKEISELTERMVNKFLKKIFFFHHHHHLLLLFQQKMQSSHANQVNKLEEEISQLKKQLAEFSQDASKTRKDLNAMEENLKKRIAELESSNAKTLREKELEVDFVFNDNKFNS